MGKLTEFSITLANPQAVYFPGQNVQGHVTVVLNDAMKMRGVRLKFHGGANVHWTEQHSTGSGKNRRTETRHYRATETYFNHEMLLFGPGNDSTHLQAGHHTFPFSYNLPVTCPSSYESHVGQVRYVLNGTIDKPWKFDHHTKKMITVLSLLDLNAQPNAGAPSAGEKSKMLCCLCCKSGPISAQVHIDRTGYVPGESIIVKADISNLSTRKMCSSKFRLIMNTTYHASSKSKTERCDVASVSHGEIPPGGEDSWRSERIVVPAVPPSFLLGCAIIDIRYVLQLDVDPAGPAFDLEVPLEIVIGTIPLRQSIQQQWSGGPGAPMPPLPTTVPSAPAASDMYMSNMNPDMAMPPPSYAECVFGKSNVREEGESEHIRGDTEFTPRYTYYDWSKHPST